MINSKSVKLFVVLADLKMVADPINTFFNAVIPLTQTGGWRGVGDVIAVGFYLLGVVPLVGLSLIDLGIIKKGKSPEEKLQLHATFVAVFLVVAHIAMIFGMLNPTVLGWNPSGMETMQM